MVLGPLVAFFFSALTKLYDFVECDSDSNDDCNEESGNNSD